MKKLTVVLCACMALSACAPFEPDLDRAATKRGAHLAAERNEVGCQLTDDHAAYRDCLMRTYYASKPKTYKTTVNEKGKSVAIVKNTTTNSYDEENDIYKTERVIVIESEEKLVPVPAVKSENTTAEVVGATTAAAVADGKTDAEVGAEMATAKAEVAQDDPAQKESWWQRYQKNKKPKDPDIQCPCADPNDPCPQCYDK